MPEVLRSESAARYATDMTQTSCLICGLGPHEPKSVHAYVTATQWYEWLRREGDPTRGPDPSVSPLRLAASR
jgi:hypothetical protein